MTYDPIDTSASDDTADSSATIDEIDATVLQGLNLDEAPAGQPVSIVEENGQTVFTAGVEATGGTTVTTFTESDGTEYQIHAFENVGSDTFTVNNGGTADVLVVGGGGAGGGDAIDSGGGGAGGLVFEPNTPISTGSFSIVVGDGGNTPTNRVNGEDGDNSSAFGLTAIGGGGGGTFSEAGRDGGSGGGAGENGINNGGDGLQPNSSDGGFGNDGGGNSASSNNRAAGGGGAGEAGASAQQSSDGGDGLDFSAEFGTTFGENGFFAGGGGGGGDSGEGFGGTGGGGDGRTGSQSNLDAIPNTGGGGGGGANNPLSGSSGFGGDGGSGIVLIRYEI